MKQPNAYSAPLEQTRSSVRPAASMLPNPSDRDENQREHSHKKQDHYAGSPVTLGSAHGMAFQALRLRPPSWLAARDAVWMPIRHRPAWRRRMRSRKRFRSAVNAPSASGRAQTAP